MKKASGVGLLECYNGRALVSTSKQGAIWEILTNGKLDGMGWILSKVQCWVSQLLAH